MFRTKSFWAIAALTLLLAPALATPAQAQLPFSFYASGLVGAQSQEITLNVSGTDAFTTSSAVAAYGAEVGVSLPMGVYIDGHYLRHSNDFARKYVTVDAFVDMAANEFGGSIEKHFGLIPASPVKPFVGVGLSYSRITLAGSVEIGPESASMDGTADVYRFYGVAGLKLTRVLRLTVTGGLSKGTIDSADNSYTVGTDTVTIATSYDGYYVQGGISLGF